MRENSTYQLMADEEVNRDLFANERSYKAALYALGCARKLNKLLSKGAWFVSDVNEIDRSGVFVCTQCENHFSLRFKHDSVPKATVTTEIVGDVSNEDGLVWLTKKNIDEWFSRNHLIEPKHLSSIKSLLRK